MVSLEITCSSLLLFSKKQYSKFNIGKINWQGCWTYEYIENGFFFNGVSLRSCSLSGAHGAAAPIILAGI